MYYPIACSSLLFSGSAAMHYHSQDF